MRKIPLCCLSLLLAKGNAGVPGLSVTFHHGSASSPLAAITELAGGDGFLLTVRLSSHIKGNILNIRENTSISLELSSLLYTHWGKCLLRHSNSNRLNQSYLIISFFFFSIEMKVTEWISFGKKSSVTFSCTLDWRCTAKEVNKVRANHISF